VQHPPLNVERLRLFCFCSWLRMSTLLEYCFICCCLVWLRIVTLLLGLTLGRGPTGRGVV
ncbi:unnamed protein product, partial [Ectocarpus sp. 4 AP-2014]